jgi:hypothetical protein
MRIKFYSEYVKGRDRLRIVVEGVRIVPKAAGCEY